MVRARFSTTTFPRVSHVLGCGLVLVALSSAANANAEGTTAETLYQEGQRAAQAKNWELACKMFRESQEREPAPGTLLNLANCEENLGALLAARAHFEAAAKSFRPGDDRVAYANKRVEALNARIPKLTVRLSPRAPAATTIERDGLKLGPAALGMAASMDPGPHTLVVHVPGQPEERVDVRLAPGETQEIELPRAVVEAPAPSASPAASPALSALPTAPAAGRSSGSGLRVAGWTALGVGVAGLAVGAVGGVLTLSAKSDVDANCPTAGCNPTGLDAQDRGRTWSTISDVGFIAGAVVATTGVTLLLLSSKHGDVSAQPVAGGGALRWVGSF